MSFHREILTPTQGEALGILGPQVAPDGFYLGGGTAVALHLGHRRSEDFDWFTPGRFPDPLSYAQKLRSHGLDLGDVQVAPGTLHGAVQGIRVSFFAYLYPSLTTPIAWPEYAFAVASLDDLACMKLAAVAQRGSRKDFMDVYAIARRHKPLPDLLQLYQRKYSTTDVGHVLVSLAYFDDADEEPDLRMVWDITWEEVKNQIRRWVKEYAG